MDARFLSHYVLYSGHFEVTKRNVNAEVSFGYHYHDFYEFQFYISPEDDGEIGSAYINGNSYPLHHGDIVMLKIFERHDIRIDQSRKYFRYCISVDPDFLLSVGSDNSNMLSVITNSNVNYPVSHPAPERFQNLLSIFAKRENTHLIYGKDIMDKSFFYEVCANLYDLFYDGSKPQRAEAQYTEILAKLVHYIDEHLADDLSLETLSSVANFSTYHLCRFFKAHTGSTLNKYTVSKRIERAKLLMLTEASISNISKDVGFNNYNHFYRTFKQLTGLSPVDYKQLHAGAAQE